MSPLPLLLKLQSPDHDDQTEKRRYSRIATGTDSAPHDDWPRTASFRALTEGRPKFKSAQIRLLWPQIKETVAAGHKLRQIWECLNEDGIHVSYAKFRYYVARLKRADMSGQPAPQLKGNAADRKADPVIPERDPVANLRERMNKRPGFQFDESPPDIKKLV